LSLGRVTRGALWLTLGIVLSNFFGLIYWIIVSGLVDANIVGRAAAIIGMEALIAGFLNLGTPVGVQRFMGASYGLKDYHKLSEYFYSNTLFMFIVSFLAGLFFIFLSFMSINPFSLDSLSLILLGTLIIVGMNSWSGISQSFCNSVLATEYIALSQLISSLLRLAISLTLIFAGYSFLGIMAGYIIAASTSSIFMLILPIKMLARFNTRFLFSLSSIKNSVKAGIVSWIPNILSLSSQWIGVLGVYAFVGSQETGLYFMALTITSVVVNFSQSILMLSFPMVSGMIDGRKRMLSRVVRFSASLMMPLIFFLITYPHVIPMFLGKQYMASSELIRVISMGYILSPIILGYVYYAYAIDRYRDVLMVELAGAVPRLILYPFMINLYGELGVAITFSIASPIQLLIVIRNALKINYKLYLKDYLKIIIIPCVTSIALALLNLNWLISLLILLSTSYITYARINMITKDDLREVGEALFSRRILEKIYPHIRQLLSIIYGT
jgi:O-antigen/teichoic acid export membrane protein